jgi:hypothetical protein
MRSWKPFGGEVRKVIDRECVRPSPFIRDSSEPVSMPIHPRVLRHGAVPAAYAREEIGIGHLQGDDVER